MAKKVLIVTKDRMEFNLYHPVALALEKAGCEVIVVAEGLSMEMWVKSGRQIYGGLPAEGSFDPNTLIRADIDPVEMFRKLSPDLVFAGLADPIHLAEQFAFVANEMGIKVGFVEDLWNVHRRSNVIPDLICTPDAYGEQVINAYELYQNRPHVYVTGSPADDALRLVKPDLDTEEILGRPSRDHVVLIGGQDEATTPMLKGLLDELKYGDLGSCTLIPRFHPKWMSDPSKASFADEWRSLIYRMEKFARVLWTPPSIKTQSLILSSTHVVSVYSNILREAALMGRLAVSLMSDVGRERMQASFKNPHLDTFPLVELGAAVEIREADSFPWPRYSTAKYATLTASAREVVQSDGLATERVTKAILTELG